MLIRAFWTFFFTFLLNSKLYDFGPDASLTRTRHVTARHVTLRHITKRNDTVRHMHITEQHGRYHITSSQRIARQREERKVRAKCCDFAGVSSNSEDLPGAHCGFDSLMKCFRKRAIKEKPSGPYQIILVRGLTILKTHLLSHSRAFLG